MNFFGQYQDQIAFSALRVARKSSTAKQFQLRSRRKERAKIDGLKLLCKRAELFAAADKTYGARMGSAGFFAWRKQNPKVGLSIFSEQFAGRECAKGDQ